MMKSKLIKKIKKKKNKKKREYLALVDDLKNTYKNGKNILTNFNGMKLKKMSIN